MQKFTFLVGEEGENLVISHLQSKGFLVEDLRQDPKYQAQDIDMSLTTPSGKRYTVEIKTDTIMHKTRNIMVEISMSRKTGIYQGWYYKCKADLLCYVDAHAGILYFLPWQKLNTYVTHLMEADKSCICDFTNPYDDCCVGKGVLLSVKKHLELNNLILITSYCEEIQKAAACREANISMETKDNNISIIIPA